MQNSDTDRLTAKFYESYVEHGAIQEEAARSAISRYFSTAFKAGEKVLDLGSGSGRDLAVLLEAGADAYGIEPNDSMRAYALNKHPQLAARVQSGSLPISGLPFGGHFDAVLCSAVLMHVPEEQFVESWKSIRRLLKPNGRVLLSLPFMRPDLLQDDRDKDGRFFTNHRTDFLRSVLTSLGFKEIELGAQANSEYLDVTWSIHLFDLAAPER